MKTTIKTTILGTMLTLSMAFAADGHGNHGSHSGHKMESRSETSQGMPHKMEHMNPEMKKHANEVYAAYLTISTNLAADDFKKAKHGVMKLVKAAEKAPKKHVESEHHKKMMNLIHGMHGAGDIATLRDRFQAFSEEYISHMKMNASVLEKEFKIFYCPMKKGRWVQDKAGTKNPYYGASMLTCGGEEK